MTPARWLRASALLKAALELDRSARPAFLADACGDEHELRRELESLIAADSAAGAFLSGGPGGTLSAAPGDTEPWSGDEPLPVPVGETRPPERVGRFRIEAEVGRGGMGIVYSGRSPLGRRVAIKALRADVFRHPDRLAHFRREARLLALVVHPHIARVHGFEEIDGRHYLILELVPGESLAQRLARGAVREADAVRWFGQACLALAAAHERGVVHGDIKPDNVRLTESGDVKLVDFGIARLLDGRTIAAGSPGDGLAFEAKGDGIAGTPAYMSPERVMGEPPDAQSDLWSLGCVLFECLAGRRPWAGASAHDRLRAALRREPDWAALPAHLSEPARAVIVQCLDPEPSRRPRGALEARRRLEEPAGPSLASEAAAVAGALGLPLPSVRLIGRDAELRQVAGLLQTARLVTLTALAGTGKSRLAVALLADRDAFMPEQTCWVDLAPIADPALVAAAVMAGIDLAPAPGVAPIERLRAALRGRRLLLVLDGCEHVLAACAELATQLLGSCPAVRILATSREPLDVEGELVFRLAPLALPPLPAQQDGPPPGSIGSAPAVRLFLARAEEAVPGHPFDHDSMVRVARLVRALDGVPLAIEVAAARLRDHTLEELVASLGDELGAAGQDGAVATIVAWSHARLDPSEQRTLRRMAVFAGGFTLEAAAAVIREGDGDDLTFDLVLRLVERALAVIEPCASGVRYRLLELPRAFAAARLRQSGEEGLCLDRLQRHYADALEASDVRDPLRARQMEPDRDNFRAVLRDDTPLRARTALRLAAALRRFWVYTNSFEEGLAHLERLLDHDANRPPDAYRGRALLVSGGFAAQCGRGQLSLARLDEAVAIARSLEDRSLLARATSRCSLTLNRLGRVEEARAAGEESIVVGRGLDDCGIVADILFTHGGLLIDQGDPDGGERYLQESLEQARAGRDPFSESQVLWALGCVRLSRADIAGADRLARRSLEIARSVGHHVGIARNVSLLGELALELGDAGRARRLFLEGRDLSLRTGRPATEMTINLGHAALHDGDREAAEAAFQQSLDSVRAASGDPYYEALALAGLAQVAQGRSAHARARELRRLSLSLLVGIQHRLAAIEVCEEQAELESWCGRMDDAARLLAAASAAREELRSPRRPLGRARDDRAAVAAEAALGGERYRFARDEGRKLGFDGMAALGLELCGAPCACPEPPI